MPALMSPHPDRTEEGFTLIELLVVILVIGILSAIAIPAFLNQRKSAADATLQSDLHNSSTVVQTWLSKPGNNAAKLKSELLSKTSGLVEGPNADNAFGTQFRWNDAANLPKITVSEGTSLEIPMIPAPVSDWTAHETGEFCIKGANAGSNYNARLYDDTSETLNKSLYYDVKAGGVKTMEQLVTISNSGQSISCTGYVKRFIAAQS